MSEEYQRGLNDAWEYARKIAEREDDMRNCFHDIAPAEIFGKYSASEAIAKIKKYEERTKINIGDEVSFVGRVGIVTMDCSDGYFKILGKNGDFYVILGEMITKTGRRNDRLLEIIKQIGVDDE